MMKSFQTTQKNLELCETVNTGLSGGFGKKHLEFKFLYDQTGSELFEEITKTQEYYLTRTELGLLDRYKDEIADVLDVRGNILVEFGSGTSEKTKTLLRAWSNSGILDCFVPVDISSEFLQDAAAQLQREFPRLSVIPQVRDITLQFSYDLPRELDNRKKIALYLGSSIGNFSPESAAAFLRKSSESGLLIGVDLKKDPTRLHLAYNDSAGVSSAFALNIIKRISLEFAGDENLLPSDNFAQYSFFNPTESRIEVHLVAKKNFVVSFMWIRPAELPPVKVEWRFQKGESIFVEPSHKYTIDSFTQLAQSAGLSVCGLWTDENEDFALFALRPSMFDAPMALTRMRDLHPPSKFTSSDIKRSFDAEIKRTRAIADRFFEFVKQSGAMYMQPIALRNPFIFYYGHMPCFYNIKFVQAVRKQAPFDAELDLLTERGRDPNVLDPSKVHSHSSLPDDWPTLAVFEAYVNKCREVFDQQFALTFENFQGMHQLETVIGAMEHEMMHLETLCYMLAQLPVDIPRANNLRFIDPPARSPRAIAKQMLEITAGHVSLGVDQNVRAFAWDNEMPRVSRNVEAFYIANVNVTNAKYLQFVLCGEYENRAHWSEAGWAAKSKYNWRYPQSMVAVDEKFFIRRAFEEPIPLDRASDWPVLCSLDEAHAYANWKNARIASEAELARAFYCDPHSDEQFEYPWGNEAPSDSSIQSLANCSWQFSSPTPVGMFPRGKSAFGLYDCIGSAWEWTSTPFNPLDKERFNATWFYPQYSSDFFDQLHFVMLGASWATDVSLIRPSFRNWYQSNYPYVFAKFRLVRDTL